MVPVSYLLLDRLVGSVSAYWRRAATPAMAKAVRVTTMVLLVALAGAVWAVTRAYAQTPGSAPAQVLSQAPGRALTFEGAQRALENNESLKAAAAQVHEADARVSEARASFLPRADVSYLFTPAQQAAALQIPAGIFGQDAQIFRANFIRQNVLRFDVTQPLYVGGKLQSGLAATASLASSAQHQFDRARQALTLEVVQAYYGALLQQQGIAVAEEGLRRAELQERMAQTRFDAGTAARLDVLRAGVEVANARAVLIRARSAADTAQQALRAVMSLDDSAPTEALQNAAKYAGEDAHATIDLHEKAGALIFEVAERERLLRVAAAAKRAEAAVAAGRRPSKIMTGRSTKTTSVGGGGAMPKSK